MSFILNIIQIVLSILLIITILLQQKGSGTGAAFGGQSGSIVSSRRGMDKVLFNITVVLSVLFFLIAILNLVV
ncbi:MAG: preprotein translocase subunit SecG [Patescibacteria group bacterium]